MIYIDDKTGEWLVAGASVLLFVMIPFVLYWIRHKNDKDDRNDKKTYSRRSGWGKGR